MTRDLEHYLEMFSGDESVGRKIVARGIYAARHGTADDPDREELAEITRGLPETMSAGEAFVRVVRAYREREGLSQPELAERLDTDQQRISEWETGKHTPGKAWRKLMRFEITG